jgi:WD40 repeat protein
VPCALVVLFSWSDPFCGLPVTSGPGIGHGQGAEGRNFSVNARGVQLGDGNTQNNYFYNERIVRWAVNAALVVIFLAWPVSADQPDLAPVLHFPGWASAVAFSPDGRTLACGTGDPDDKVTLWDVANPERPGLLSTLTGYGRTVRTVDFSPNGHILATASWDATVVLWDVANPARPVHLDTITASHNIVEALAFSPGGNLLITGDGDGKVFLWNVVDPANPILVKSFSGGAGDVRNAAFSPSGRVLATANGNHLAILWDMADPAAPRIIARLNTYRDSATAAIFSPNGRYLAVSSNNGTVTLWNVANPARPVLARTFTAYFGDWAGDEAYSPNGGVLATANRPDAAVLWDVENPAQPKRGITFSVPSGNPRYVEAVAFSPDGEWLAVASYNHTVTMWPLPEVALVACGQLGLRPARG